MDKDLKTLFLAPLQWVAILAARPYVRRELFGWGAVYAAFVGDYRRDWLWATAPTKVVRGKVHGYTMRLDLSNWADRAAFFLGRWYDLGMQLLAAELLKPGDTVIDVGANRGMFALVASRLVGPSGKVICFEPNPACYAFLKEEISANGIENIVTHPIGLGHHADELTLSVPAVNSGEGTFGASKYDDGAVSRVRCRIEQGDVVLADEAPTLIKIDVEGFECSVIAGLSETIRRHKPILVTEVFPSHLASCGSSVAELLAPMQELGYRGFRIDLKRSNGSHDWALIPFEAQEQASDVIWLHSHAIGRYRQALEAHGISFE